MKEKNRNKKDIPDDDKQRKVHKRRKKVIKLETILIFTAVIVLVCSTLYSSYKSSAPVSADMDYTEFEEHVDKGEIDHINLVGTQRYFTVILTDGTKRTVTNPGHDEFKKDLLESGVKIQVQNQTPLEAVTTAILTIPMMCLVLILVWYILKASNGQTNTLYKVYKPEDIIKFDQVAGMSETKEEVRFAISQLNNSSRLKELGTRPCKGIILEGPPGTGKTLLAKAIAGEADVPFISTSGADFIEMFAGLGAARVRNLWELALINAPCVVFIDEIDAVGRRRSGGGDGATTEANQTLNELLTKMDGLSPSAGIFVVGATNRIEDLDPALIRPGRFDKRLYIGPPKTKKDRDEVVALYLNGKKLDESVTIDSASRIMFGLSGAEIEQVLNESVLISLQMGHDGIVTLDDIDRAAMKQRASGVSVTHSSKDDIRISAIHEAGHAVVSSLLGRKVSKVSITPYNSGLGGMTVRNTDDIEDKRILIHEELLDEIKVLLAGRAAEKCILGDTSVGCSNDIERVTTLAYKMIYNFAMGEALLINPDMLVKMGVINQDGKDTVNNVNRLVYGVNDSVVKMIESHKDEIKALADQLEIEENIFDYTVG